MPVKIQRALITESPEALLAQYGDDIMHSAKFLQMKQYRQHRNSTAYDHSVQVAITAIQMAKKRKLQVDAKSLVRGCLLHDYWCYDCHAKGHPGWHLFLHGIRAAKNAEQDFGINFLEADMITNHMWPLHPFRFPISVEAWLLCLADKKVSILERFPKKKKEREKAVETTK